MIPVGLTSKTLSGGIDWRELVDVLSLGCRCSERAVNNSELEPSCPQRFCKGSVKGSVSCNGLHAGFYKASTMVHLRLL